LEYVETALKAFLLSELPARVTAAAAVSPTTAMGGTLTSANFTRGQKRLTKYPVIQPSALQVQAVDRTAQQWLVTAQVFVILDMRTMGGDLEQGVRALQRYEQVIAEALLDTSASVQGQRLGGSANSAHGVIDVELTSSEIQADIDTEGGALVPVGATLIVDLDVLLDVGIVV